MAGRKLLDPPVASRVVHLDDLDVAILRALTEDARRSLRDVASLAGTTPTTVSVRLERMKQAGLVRGASLDLDPARLPGRARLLEGEVDTGASPGFLEVAAGIRGVEELAVTPDGRVVALLRVLGLEDEERITERLRSAGARGLRVSGAARASGPAPTHLFENEVVVEEACAVCGKKVGADALSRTIDGRRVVFCCTSCQRDYTERYERFSKEAGKARPKS